MGRLVVSANAHVIASYHSIVDKVTERFLGKNKIGTTGRGIGPAYADKINRVGIRIADVFDEEILREKVEAALEVKNHLLTKVYNRRAITVDEVVEDLLSYADRLQPLVADTSLLLNRALDEDKTVLFEGAQATMLDVDHGTYPFVTSSNPVSGGVCTGAGVGPTRIDRVIGVIKAYTTRVGSGPFPTELFDEDGEKLWKVGGEVGVSTGRDRRCGWYDAVVARYATRVNGLTEMFMTKLDVLSSWERVPVCVAYDVDGVRHDEMPMTQTEFHRATPIYEYLDGWADDISGCRSFERPAEERPALRARARGDVGRAVLGRRRRARVASRPSSSADVQREASCARSASAPGPLEIRQHHVAAGDQEQQVGDRRLDCRALARPPGVVGRDQAVARQPLARHGTGSPSTTRAGSRWPLPRWASPARRPSGRPCPGRARGRRSAARASLTPGAFRREPTIARSRAAYCSTGSSAWRTPVSWIIRSKLPRARTSDHAAPAHLRQGQVSGHVADPPARAERGRLPLLG